MQAGSTVRGVIESQGEAWAQVLSSPTPWNLRGRVLCVGSGTSYYLALVVAALGKKLGLDVAAVPTQDVILDSTDTLKPYDSVVIISRSGETSEALWSADIARKHQKRVLGVTCNDKSPLPSRVDEAWVFPFAHDHTVVMVKSFSSMLTAFERAFLEHTGNEAGKNALQEVTQAARDFIALSDETMRRLTSPPPRRVYILGAGVRYGVALEGSLKCLEMSNENAAAYGPLEFRHGPWGSVTDDDLVVLLGQTAFAQHERQVLTDLSHRTNRLLTIARADWFDSASPGERLILPAVDDLWSGPLSVVPLQWLGYYWALSQGLNPDAPKNLTQVVDLSYGKH